MIPILAFSHPEGHPAQRQIQNTNVCGECGKVTNLTDYDVFVGANLDHYTTCSQWKLFVYAPSVANKETCAWPECNKEATVEVTMHSVKEEPGENPVEVNVPLGFCPFHAGEEVSTYEPEGYDMIVPRHTSRGPRGLRAEASI